MDIFNAKGGPYFDGLDVSNNQIGDWFSTESHDTQSISVELHGLTGTVTGELSLEFTADPAKQRGIGPAILPDGALHSTLSGVALATARDKVTLTAVAAGAFSVGFSAPLVGSMRWRYKATSGVGKITGHVQARRNV